MITAHKPNRIGITRKAYLSGGSSCEILHVARHYVGVALLLLMSVASFVGCSMAKPFDLLVRGGSLSTDSWIDKQLVLPLTKKRLRLRWLQICLGRSMNKLGDTNAKQGEVIFAAVHYEKALEIEPSSVPTRYKVAQPVLGERKG